MAARARGGRRGRREEGHRGDEEQEDAGEGGHGEAAALAGRIWWGIGGRCCRVGGEILLWGMVGGGLFDSSGATRLGIYWDGVILRERDGLFAVWSLYGSSIAFERSTRKPDLFSQDFESLFKSVIHRKSKENHANIKPYFDGSTYHLIQWNGT